MPTIYELNQQQRELLDHLFWMEEGTPEAEVINFHLNSIKGEAENKLSFLSDVLAELKSIAEAQDLVAKKTKARATATANKYEKLREFILLAMTDFGFKKITGDHHDLSIQNGPKKLVYSEDFNISNLPDFCVQTIPAQYNPIALEVLALIESGEVIDGIDVVQSPSLRLR